MVTGFAFSGGSTTVPGLATVAGLVGSVVFGDEAGAGALVVPSGEPLGDGAGVDAETAGVGATAAPELDVVD